VTDNGKIPVPSIFHDVVTVTRENLEQTVIADGFHPRDQVFKTAAPQ
jgi:D-xylose transport system substrate-binding protein